MTWVLLAFSFVVFYIFGRFTLGLMRKHRDIYGLLYAMEEEGKKKGSS
jgi:hypothetical protein